MWPCDAGVGGGACHGITRAFTHGTRGSYQEPDAVVALRKWPRNTLFTLAGPQESGADALSLPGRVRAVSRGAVMFW